MHIYIHIPFCRQKCYYCYYYSFVPKNKSVTDKYLFYLEKEIQLKSEKFNLLNRNDIETVYIGGGTPNYLSNDQLKNLFAILKKYLNLSRLKETTIEINPASCDLNQLKLLKKSGVTRLSFGIQTLDKEILKSVNRDFSAKPIYLINFAKKLGFEINLDFILGLPGQTIKDVKASLRLVEMIKPDSSFWCKLRIGTSVMRKMQPFIPSEKKVTAMHKLVSKKLKKLKYKQIIPEFFTFRKQAPLYLADFWTSDESLGFGLSSFSKINGKFIKMTGNLDNYCKSLSKNILPIHYIYKFSQEEGAFLSLQSLFRVGKIDLKYIQKKFQIDIKKLLSEELKQLEKKKLIKCQNKKILLGKNGFCLASPVSTILLGERKRHLGRLADTAFNFIDNASNIEELIYGNFHILKKDKKGNVIFSSPDKKSIGIINTKINV